MSVPIKLISGLELIPMAQPGICRARVLDIEARNSLSWDRYVRLKAASDAIKRLANDKTTMIDVGGYDGALALFLPGYCIDVIDPATTGAPLLQVPVEDRSYELGAAIDVLEHITPSDRKKFLHELARVARDYLILNYPHKESQAAQELVLKATNNTLIREHVEWELPDTDQVVSTMEKLGFKTSVTAHSSLAVWVGQYLTLNLAPDSAQEMNRYLIDHHSDEPFSVPLYHLVVGERVS